MAKPEKAENKIDDDNMVSNGEITNQESFIKRKNKAKIAKSKNLVRLKNHDFSLYFKNMGTVLSFFTSKDRLIFTKLRQIFINA